MDPSILKGRRSAWGNVFGLEHFSDKMLSKLPLFNLMLLSSLFLRLTGENFADIGLHYSWSDEVDDQLLYDLAESVRAEIDDHANSTDGSLEPAARI
ncbi:hypothetical protein BDW68DRAFT_183423 [Aspergillus falconensis]